MGKENKNKTKFREWLTKKESEGGAGFTQPDKNKDIFDKEDMRVYFLNGSFRDNSGPKINAYSDNANATKLFEEYKAAYKSKKCEKKFFFLSFLGSGFDDLSDKYVLSVEPFDGKDAVNTSTTSLKTTSDYETLKKMLEDGLKSDKSCVCIDGQCHGKSQAVGKKYWLRFIKIVDINGNTTYDIVKHYLELSDSRTYKDTVYVTNWIATEMHKNNAKNLGLPRNLLIYGAPGTGKSHYIDDKFEKDFYCVPEETEKLEQYRKELSEKLGIDIPEDADIKATIKNEFFTRVTFYKDYSYENFVGCYKPIKKDDKITYEFEAGPFIDIYIKAKKDSKHNYLLAIEEINRANAAAVFGDLFQVLDRDNDGSSEYSVKPEAALNKYLEEHLPNYDGTISLPSNLYIWATMNSADQGVHVLDSAFKRRWQFLYMDIDNSESAAKIDDDIYLPVKDGIRKCKWNQFRKAINKVLKDNKIEEDRWVGAWFFKKDELKLIRTFYENKDNTKLKPNPLVDKLLAYLLQDVVKMNKDILFKTDYHNMSSIRKALSNSEVNIFDVLTQKINIDKKEDEDIADKREIVLPVGDNKTETYTWGSFRKAVNEVLEKNNIEKDRQIEAWFFKGRELKSIETFYKEKGTDNKDNPLVDKLLAYLLQDVVKMNKDILFKKEEYHNMSSIRRDLSNSTPPKNIFDILNIKIDENALEEVPKTENPTPTDTAVTENG